MFLFLTQHENFWRKNPSVLLASKFPAKSPNRLRLYKEQRCPLTKPAMALPTIILTWKCNELEQRTLQGRTQSQRKLWQAFVLLKSYSSIVATFNSRHLEAKGKEVEREAGEGKDGDKIFYTYNHLDIVLGIIRLEEDKKPKWNYFLYFGSIRPL